MAMQISPEKLRLKAELLYNKQGVLPFVAALFLVLAVLFGVLVVPGQLAAKDSAARELNKLTKQQINLRLKPGQQRLSPAQSLARVLGDPETTNAQIRALLDFAANSGVVVVQADYRRVADSQRAYSQLQIALPVKADYLALRKFIYSVLSEMPALSLDQLIVKRDQANGAQIDAQMVFSLWQRMPQVVSDGSAAGGAK